MIEELTDFGRNVVAFAAKGHVSRDDYEEILVPAVEKALKEHDKIRLYYQIGPDYSGIEPGAAWEDFKVGIEHLMRWERIAVVTDVDWIRHTMGVLGFLMPGEVKVYPIAETSKAREWILAAT